MIATVSCAKCGLQARYRALADNPGQLEFDAAQFRADCLTSADSQSYDCPDLVGAIKNAVVEPDQAA
jgi:hypothetical protein